MGSVPAECSLEEPAFRSEDSKDPERLTWENFDEIPPALIARVRRREA
jgi:hypothetical protein